MAGSWGGPSRPNNCPSRCRAYEAFKAALAAGDQEAPLPAVNFQLLTALPLERRHIGSRSPAGRPGRRCG